MLPRLFVDALFGYDFFISYAHADGKDYPKKLSEDLATLGFETHLDTRDYHVGCNLDRLTKLRLKNSRNLVVICRPKALNHSEWVRREIDAFELRGQGVRLIDVEEAVKRALLNPAAGTTAEWLSDPVDPASDKSRAEVLLSIKDRSDRPDDLRRVPKLSIAEALQRAFTDQRRRTVRLQVLTGVLALFVLLTIGLAAASSIAVTAAKRAEREALTAQLQLSAAEAERLSTTPDTYLALRKVLEDVEQARAGLGSISARTRLALWRVLNTVRDLKVWTTTTSQIYSIGWDPASERIITLERDGGVSAYSLDGTHHDVIAPTGGDNAQFWFSESGLAIQRAEGDAQGVYSLNGELLLRHVPGANGAEGYVLRDISPITRELLWSGDDGCLRMTPIDRTPARTAPLHCIEDDGFDLARFAAGNNQIFYATDEGTVRLLDARSGVELAANRQTLPFDVWRLRDDARALIGFRADRIIRMDGSLKVVASRSLDADENAEFVGGAVLWEDNRILTVGGEGQNVMQMFALNLEPAGPPFRLHANTTIGAAPSQSVFLSAGYLDHIVRLISPRTPGSDIILNDSDLNIAQIAYCPCSAQLFLGDFDGSVHRLDPDTPTEIQSQTLNIGDMIESVVCLDNDRWVATTGGRLFTSQTFDPADVSTIDIPDGLARHLAKYGDSVILASEDHIYLIDEQALARGGVLHPDDALSIALPGDEGSMIFFVAADPNRNKISIGVKHDRDDASLVLVTLDGGQAVTARVTKATGMETPEAIAFSPDGTRATVSGSMLRLETFDQAGGSIWSLRGGDNPFVASLAYVDNDFFLGGGLTGGISLWSREGTVLDADFDADLRGSFVSLTPGAPGEMFATDSEGTLKRLEFDVADLEALALDVLRNRGLSK